MTFDANARPDVASEDAAPETPQRPRRRGIVRGAARAALAVGLAVSSLGAVQLRAAEVEPGAEADLLALRSSAAAGSSRSEFLGRVALDEQPLTLTISVDGETVTHSSHAATVGEALAEAGVVVDGDDEPSVALDTKLSEDMDVAIKRVEVSTVSEEVVEPHASTRVESAQLAKGTEKVTTEGVDGRAVDTYEVTLVDGVEVSRNRVASAVSQRKVDEVVTVGTRAGSAGSATPSGSAPATGPVLAGSNREIGQSLAAARGWTGSQWSCLDSLWQRESGWNHLAANPSSGAYGIPQALPGSKMATVAADWRTNPATQITWGMNYIAGRYGTPCGAWSHSQASGWY